MMELHLLLLALRIVLILYLQKQKAKPVENLQPPGLPFIGNLHQFDGQYPHKYLYNLSKQYGPFMSMKLGYRPVLVISSADMVEQIMKSHDIVFSGRPRLVSLQRLSYNDLDVTFSTYSNMWREMRKICIISLFSLKQFHRCFIPECKDEVSRMIKKIGGDTSQSRITDLSEMAVPFTSNTICRVAFGKRGGDDWTVRGWFFDLMRETQALAGGFFLEDYLPSLRWIDRQTGMAGRLEKNFRDLDSFYQELIEEHLDSKRPKSMEGDILDSLLGLKRDGSSSVDLTLDHIKALLMVILSSSFSNYSFVF
ncbi:cytochrome [Sesamum alatum]|uniref:Cytochrome n=1 Tax=Sesamum alatum TaxID=300844 RepID=A0AAE1YBS6_9LAMI|nr:cytochrome [Sesamum alatum]